MNPAQELHITYLKQVIILADNCSHFIVHLTSNTSFRTINLSGPTRLLINTVIANQTTPTKDLTMLFGIPSVSLIITNIAKFEMMYK